MREVEQTVLSMAVAGFAAHLIQVLVITCPPIVPWITGIVLLQQVTQSVGDLRSLAIGVSQRDPFVELIDVTGALGRSRRIVASPCLVSHSPNR
jgi:hypothetical protein